MKVWLDDLRSPPDGWAWAKTVAEALDLLRTGEVTEISLDHDLGGEADPFGPDADGGTGYTVACWIELNAYEGAMPRFVIRCHSANPVGRAKIAAAVQSTMRAWDMQENEPARWAAKAAAARARVSANLLH